MITKLVNQMTVSTWGHPIYYIALVETISVSAKMVDANNNITMCHVPVTYYEPGNL